MLRSLKPQRLKRWLRSLVVAGADAGRERFAGERELRRLRSLPRQEPGATDLPGTTFGYADALSFCWQYKAVFIQDRYRFDCERADPRVVDCGANVGLTTLYWTRLFPGAHVVAFEPDPQLFALLSENCARAGAERVELVNAAVWTAIGHLPFRRDGSDGGHLVGGGGDAGDPALVRVPTVRLRDYLDAPVEMLKIDIEGAEVDVVLDCADRLHNVRNLLVEYHSFRGRPQRLDRLVQALAAAGFRLHIVPEFTSPRPFIERSLNGEMDLQLDIYGYRE